MVRVDAELIAKGEAVSGALNKDQFRLIGIQWPPKHGWMSRVKQEISEQDAKEFVELAGKTRRKGRLALRFMPLRVEAETILEDIEMAISLSTLTVEERKIAIDNIEDGLKRVLERKMK